MSKCRAWLWLALTIGLAARCFAELKVSEADAKKNAIDKPAPVLSNIARQLKLKGRVEVAVSIDETGAVAEVHVETGNTILGQSAVAAVKKWKFDPFMQDGKPTKASTVLVFDFIQ